MYIQELIPTSWDTVLLFGSLGCGGQGSGGLPQAFIESMMALLRGNTTLDRPFVVRLLTKVWEDSFTTSTSMPKFWATLFNSY